MCPKKRLQQHLPFTVLKLITIEEIIILKRLRLQQHLPFTVLKQNDTLSNSLHYIVATAPTVYGIETWNKLVSLRQFLVVATAPTVYGIETIWDNPILLMKYEIVATAPTVYGIETISINIGLGPMDSCNSTYRLRY